MNKRPQTSRIGFISPIGLAAFGAVLYGAFGNANEYQKSPQARPTTEQRTRPGESELWQFRTEIIEKIKETRDGAEKLLALHEAERQRRAENYQRQRELYAQGLIARSEVLQAERALEQAAEKVDEDRRWLAETDAAITEVTLRDELLRLSKLALGTYVETGTLMHFNGGLLWRLADAPRIEMFFVETFGRPMPISARGQTATHDRLRFDHRDAMDVALHPDSQEGQSLLNFLRQTGIPFLAFRTALPGAATGAHIHIGKPSRRY